MVLVVIAATDKAMTARVNKVLGGCQIFFFTAQARQFSQCHFDFGMTADAGSLAFGRWAKGGADMVGTAARNAHC